MGSIMLAALISAFTVLGKLIYVYFGMEAWAEGLNDLSFD